MPNNENINQNKKLPEGLSSIADDEAITEIDLGDFLEESTKSAPLFEGFHEDIENTEKSLESDLQNLYDDIMSSGPETIVPKPMSVLTEKEPPKSALDELWMNPEDYFDADIPVVSLDEDEIEEEIPEEAFFNPEAAEEAVPEEDFERNSIFSLIDSLKSESDVETGFSEILSEIESNEGIATTIDGSLADAQRLVSQDYTPEESYEEVSFGDEEFDWNDIETEDEAPAEEYAPAAEEEAHADEPSDLSVDDIVKQYATAKPEAAPAPAPVTPAAEASFDVDNIDTNSEEFDRELAFLLGEDAGEAAVAEASAQTGFVINVPDDGNDYEKAAAAPEKLYEAAPMSTIPVEESLEIVTEDDGKKKKKKEKKNKNKDNAQAEEKEGKKSGGAGEVVRKIILSVSIITIIVSCGILINTYFIEPMRFKSGNDDLVAQMQENINANGDSTEIAEEVKQQAAVDFPEGMLAKYAQLYAANDDLRGWISIPGFDINLPIAQGTDNSFYLKKDIYGKYTTYGVPFFDYRMTDFKNLHKNTVVYGHNMRYDDLIFGMLENYRFIEAGFQKAPVIECNTIYGDFTWFVYAAFISNSDASQDNGYLFPYNFIDVSDGKFADYIAEIDKRKFYTTGVDIQPTDKILTLSTCCYDFEDARLVVVARLRREGESVAVDTSRAYLNDDIKYPQIWYDVNKKTNNHASDPRW